MPNKGLKFPPEVLNREEVDRFLASFPRSTTGKRNLALSVVYLRAGLRCKEALALRPCDIDWEAGSITVLCGKGGKRRVVGIDKGSLEMMKPWSAARPVSQFYFCAHDGGPMWTSYVRRMVKRQAVKAGIEKRMHVHGLRHSHACGLADRGIDIRIISRQLGHSNVSTTARYIEHMRPDAVVQAIGAINW